MVEECSELQALQQFFARQRMAGGADRSSQGERIASILSESQQSLIIDEGENDGERFSSAIDGKLVWDNICAHRRFLHISEHHAIEQVCLAQRPFDSRGLA